MSAHTDESRYALPKFLVSSTFADPVLIYAAAAAQIRWHNGTNVCEVMRRGTGPT